MSAIVQNIGTTMVLGLAISDFSSIDPTSQYHSYLASSPPITLASATLPSLFQFLMELRTFQTLPLKQHYSMKSHSIHWYCLTNELINVLYPFKAIIYYIWKNIKK